MEENFSPQESLELIQSMIVKAKTKLSEDSFYFLFWGWLAFLIILVQYILKVWFHYPHFYIAWLAMIPASVILIFYSRKRKRHHQVKTYLGESMGYLWAGIGCSFFALSFIISVHKQGWMDSYPFFILFYGLGTFVSGRLLKFTPLVIGGILNWFIACGAAFVSFDVQMLLTCLALLTSYIIPGHLLRLKKYN